MTLILLFFFLVRIIYFKKINYKIDNFFIDIGYLVVFFISDNLFLKITYFNNQFFL